MQASILQPQSADIQNLVQVIKEAQSILLTTHKQCDGDGLGAVLGLYHGLKKNKKMRILTVDEVPSKYDFLEHHKFVQQEDQPHEPLEETDLALILDANDRRLIEPLYFQLEKKCKKILFVDHHPILDKGPLPTKGSYIDIQAASTGEMAFHIIKHLGIPLNQTIAQALYTSIVFDTQVFRHIKGSPSSYLIAAELIKYLDNPEICHHHLFASYSPQKLLYLGKVLGNIKYHFDNQVATLLLSLEDLNNYKLKVDDSKDIIDMIMKVSCLRCAVLFREEVFQKQWKMSLRSRGDVDILSIAENFGGGGHLHAAGAEIKGDYQTTYNQIMEKISNQLK